MIPIAFNRLKSSWESLRILKNPSKILQNDHNRLQSFKIHLGILKNLQESLKNPSKMIQNDPNRPQSLKIHLRILKKLQESSRILKESLKMIQIACNPWNPHKNPKESFKMIPIAFNPSQSSEESSRIPKNPSEWPQSPWILQNSSKSFQENPKSFKIL